MPLVAGAVALAALARPAVMPPGGRLLDAALAAAVLFAALQLVPLPSALRLAVAPSLAAVDRAIYLDGSDPATHPRAPLTVDAEATAEALALAVASLLVFWSARTLLSGGTLRRVLRGLAVCGLIASGLAIVQHTTAPSMVYWTWRPINRGASPYTPFINKNDLAAWLIMAIPLTVGYMAARVDARLREGLPSPLESILDDTTAWLGGGLTAMTAALLVSLSRSGLTAAVAAAAAFLWLSRERLSRRGRRWLLAGGAAVVLVGLFYVNAAAVLVRIDETFSSGVGGRREIWSATRTMIADFPVTGVGVGAYARAMSVYQPPHDFSFNHAHDEYLQIAAEGGLVLSALIFVAILAGAVEAHRRLRLDRAPVFWIRLGAVSAIVAIAVQSIWETGLRMPANAVLFAICCGIAMHHVDAPVPETGADRR